MENFCIILLIFSTLAIINSHKSEALDLNEKNLENDENGGEILVNEKYHRHTVECHLRAQIIENHEVVENRFKLKVHGRVVNFKEIPFKNRCNGSLEIVEIFATEKIVIDRNFNAHGEHTAFIVAAPLWHVIGRRTINLNGYNGRKEKLLLKTEKSENGRDGREGLPGGAGGEFQGIAGFVINGENLVVHCNGGRGGNGGNGERGEDGWNGTEFNLNVDRIFGNGSVPGFEVNITRVKKVDNEGTDSYYINEDVLGGRAKSGGNGGNGAPGGEGGYPGYQILFNFNNSTCFGNDVREFVKESNGIKGANGLSGLGGHSGRNGRPGKDVSLSLLVRDKNEIQIFNHTVHKHDDDYKKGRRGIDGTHFIRNLKPKMKLPAQNFMTTERLFKDYLKSHINDTSVSGDSWYRTMQNVIINCSFHPKSDE